MRLPLTLFSLLLAGAASATTLTFDTNPPPVVDNRVLVQEYGDRVTGATSDASGSGAAAAGSYLVGPEGSTPNVEVTHDSAGDPVLWTTGYGDLANVSWRVNSVILAADPGVLVTFEAFDIACFGCNDGSTGPSVSLEDGLGNELWSSGGNITFADASGHETFAPLPEVSSSTVVLVLDYTGTAVSQNFVAIDNLRFRQVPGPGLGVLLGASALGLIGVRRSARRSPPDSGTSRLRRQIPCGARSNTRPFTERGMGSS